MSPHKSVWMNQFEQELCLSVEGHAWLSGHGSCTILIITSRTPMLAIALPVPGRQYSRVPKEKCPYRLTVVVHIPVTPIIKLGK